MHAGHVLAWANTTLADAGLTVGSPRYWDEDGDAYPRCGVMVAGEDSTEQVINGLTVPGVERTVSLVVLCAVVYAPGSDESGLLAYVDTVRRALIPPQSSDMRSWVRVADGDRQCPVRLAVERIEVDVRELESNIGVAQLEIAATYLEDT